VQRDACQAVLDQQGFALRANSGNKQLLLELGGALKVLTKQEKHRLPAPPPPPPPPNAERLFSWHLLERRRKHVKRHVLKLISSVGRHDATAWGKLKSVALMVPDTSRFPPTPIPTPVPTPTPTPTPNPNPNPNPNSKPDPNQVPDTSRFPLGPTWVLRVAVCHTDLEPPNPRLAGPMQVCYSQV
jgi:hypothetical protein